MKTPTHNYFIASMMLAGAMLFMTGCSGEFSYKRGAGMTDFQQEKKNCSQQNTSEYEIEQCLNESGWVVVGIDKPLVKKEPKTIVTAEGRTVVVDQEPIEISSNPLDKINISSWWKAGAGPDKLLDDSESCVSELGQEHRSEANMSIVTMGLLSCMKDKGWFALKAY